MIAQFSPLLAFSLTAPQWALVAIGIWILCSLFYAWIEYEQSPKGIEDRAARRADAVSRRQRERDDYERRKARGVVQLFYNRHVRSLESQWPRERLETHLQAAIRPDTTPADAWTASRDLISELSPLLLRRLDDEARRAAEDAARRRKQSAVDRRLAEERSRLEQLTQSPLQAEVEDEVYRVRERIRELNAEREDLESQSVDRASTR